MTSFLDLIPWETKPKTVKQEESSIFWNGGELKIPRLGYLTVNEMDEISSVDPKNALNRLLYDTSIQLYKAIDPKQESPSETWNPRRCFELLLQLHLINHGARTLLSDDEKSIEILHSDVIVPFLESATVHTNRVVIRSVTVILKRIKTDWSDELTMQLPGELRQKLYELYLEEQQAGHGKINPEEDIKALEEMLGKSLGVSPSAAIEKTGAKPTGNAKGSGQAVQNSAEKTSAPSPATTSSKRSRKVTGPSDKGFTTKSEP